MIISNQTKLLRDNDHDRLELSLSVDSVRIGGIDFKVSSTVVDCSWASTKLQFKITRVISVNKKIYLKIVFIHFISNV
jgi:hypothetical protein